MKRKMIASIAAGLMLVQTWVPSFAAEGEPVVPAEPLTAAATVESTTAELSIEEPTDAVVTFADDELKQAILDIGWYDVNGDGELSELEMDRVGKLDLSGKKIASLEGLEFAKGLTSLRIDGGTLTDAAVLEGLPRLMELTIKNTQLAKAPALVNVGQITSLDLSANRITDISGLQALEKLANLALNGNEITDISALAGKPNMNSLQLGGNQIADVSALSDMTKLSILGLENNSGIDDLSALSGMSNLYHLNISGTAVTDEDMASLTGLSLRDFYLRNCDVSDFSFTDRMTGMINLDISGTKSADFTFLERFGSLQSLALDDLGLAAIPDLSKNDSISSLSVNGNELSELSGLKVLTKLYYLRANDNQLKDISSLLELSDIGYVELKGNNLRNIFPLLYMSKLSYVNLSDNELDLSEGSQSAEIINSIKKRAESPVTVTVGTQRPGGLPNPSTEVGEVEVTSTFLLSSLSATRGDIVSVRLSCTNTSGAALTDFDFGVKLPDSVTLAAGSEPNLIHMDSLAAGEEMSIVFSVKVKDDTEASSIILVGQIIKDSTEYAVNASSVNVVYVTLNAPGVTAADEPFQVYGQVTPGSKVWITDENGRELAVAEVNGKWFNARIPAQAAGECKIQAVARRGDQPRVTSNLISIGIEMDYVLVNDVRALYYGHVYHRNPYTNFPTFSVRVNTRLIGDSFWMYTKFTADSSIERVDYTFAGRTYPAVRDDSGYYRALILDWSTTGVQKVKAVVTTNGGETLEFVVGQVTVLIDPSGYVTDSETNQPIIGVKVTLEEKQEDGSWTKWNAQAHMQENPVVTDDEGYYGWDVPEGTYRLQLEKEGYEPLTVEKYTDKNGQQSDIIVLPVRTDVNIQLTPNSVPPVVKQTVEEAKQAAQTVLAGVLFNNDTTAEGILSAVTGAVTNEDITVSWSTPFALVPATDDEPGSVKGVITLMDETTMMTATIQIDETIPALKEPQTVEEAKKAAVQAIAALSVSNDTAEADVMKAVTDCIKNADITASWTKPFTKVAAKVRVAGSIKGEITLTDSKAGTTAVVAVDLTIPDLPGIGGGGGSVTIPSKNNNKGNKGGGSVITMPPVSSPAPTAQPEKAAFADMDEYSWAKDAVTKLADAGIIHGVEEGRFAPQQNVTRADFVLLLTKVMAIADVVGESFEDVAADSYYAGAVAAAKQAGIVTGVDGASFRPEDQISRQDMFTITFRALEKAGKMTAGSTDGLAAFADAEAIESYAQEPVAALVQEGYVAGDNGNIHPENNATRAETAVFLARIFEALK